MTISGIGCCLVDYVYSNYRYEHPVFQQLLSRTPGDGGIIPGGLVFSEDLEQFAKKSYKLLLRELLGDYPPDISNLGGPSVVALVHAAQLLYDREDKVIFYGGVGDDERGRRIKQFLGKTPLSYSLKTFPGEDSPSTLVLSDQRQHNGKGERSFINTIGAAGSYGPEEVPEEFYYADIVLAGGTALVPRLHDSLGDILRKAKEKRCITVVGTVYDFRNQKRNPQSPWPLGSEGSYQHVDLLITDAEEALRLTGRGSLVEAAGSFIDYGVGSGMITHGAKEILVWSKGTLFSERSLTQMPVSRYVDNLLDANPERRKDSTGCGDNFVGGVIASLAAQLGDHPGIQPDITEACGWGAASGGFTCMYHGGTYYEKYSGEKKSAVEPIISAYLKQVSDMNKGENQQ